MEVTHLKVPYGVDPMGMGFFWPESPQKRAEYYSVKRSRPSEAQSVYQCAPGAREGSIFLESDFAYFKPPAGLEHGIMHPPVREFCRRGYQVATGWDTAFEAHSDADWTVGFAGLMLPCDQYHRGEDPAIFGPCDPHFDVMILDRIRKRLAWADLVREFRLMHQKWEPDVHVVEKKASGITLYQTMPSIGINIKGVSANESKRARAIAGVGKGSVQGWFRMGRVLFPTDTEWVASVKTEMKDFSGAEDAVDDQVDAMVHLVTHAILLGSNAALIPTEWTPERVNELMGIGSYAGLEMSIGGPNASSGAEMMAFIGGLPSTANDVFAESCSRCGHYQAPWCPIRGRQMTALDLCDDFKAARAN